MKVLCLDLATYKTGFAVYEENEKTVNLVESGTISIKQNDQTRTNIGLRLSFFKKEIKSLLEKHDPKVVVIEDTHGGNQIVAKQLNRLHGVVIVEVYEHDKLVPVIYYTANNIKKYVTNNGLATKDEVKKGVFDYIKVNLGVLISSKADDNECDALGIGITYFKKKGILK